MSVDMMVQSLFLIPLDERLGLRMVYHQALLDGLLIVIGTTTLLAALDEANHQFLLRHVQFYHSCHLVTTIVQHFLQGFSLWNGTGETVKDDALVTTSVRIIHTSQYRNHQVVRNQVALVDKALGGLTQFCTLLDFITQHIARRDVSQAIVFYHQIALRSLTRTGSAKNNNVLHFNSNLLFILFNSCFFSVIKLIPQIRYQVAFTLLDVTGQMGKFNLSHSRYSANVYISFSPRPCWS